MIDHSLGEISPQRLYVQHKLDMVGFKRRKRMHCWLGGKVGEDLGGEVEGWVLSKWTK